MLVRIARHGESEGNFAGALQGSRFDTPLSARGSRQAEFLAIRLAREAIDAVWASPMIRARETAAIVAAPLGLGVSLDGDLVEFDWGVWSGRPYDGAIEKEVSGVRARWRAGETELSPREGSRPRIPPSGRTGFSCGSGFGRARPAGRRARALQPHSHDAAPRAGARADGRDPPAERLALLLRMGRLRAGDAAASRRRLAPAARDQTVSALSDSVK